MRLRSSEKKMEGKNSGAGDPVPDKSQSLKTERKAEYRRKAREKLRADLERIRAFNAGPEKGVDALKILPKEIWGMILDEIKDPETVDSAWRTCSLFRDLLNTRRFEEVILPAAFEVPRMHKLLDDPIGPDDDKSDDEGDGNTTVNENRDEDRKEFRHFIHIRQVCKSWRKGFDLHLERRLLTLGPGYSSAHEILSDKNLDKFEEGMKLFRRAVKVTLRCLERGSMNDPPPDLDHKKVFADFISSLNGFLRIAGPQILSMDFTANLTIFRDRYGEYWDVYLVFLELLKLTPNLSNLKVNLDNRGYDEVSRDYYKSFGEVASLNPLPILTSVERLTFNVYPEFLTKGDSDDLYLNLLRACPNVKALKMDYADAEEEGDVNNDGSCDIIKLSKIADAVRSLVHMESFDLSIGLEYDLQDIVGHFNDDWKLKNIRLHITQRYGPCAAPVPLERVFRILEKYSDTLETVKLWLGVVDCMRRSCEPNILRTEFQLNLPKVKQFRMEFSSRICLRTLDFLLPMVNLELLEIEYERKFEKAQYENTVIKFRDDETYEWDLHIDRSNIWVVFPALRKVCLRMEHNLGPKLEWKHFEYTREYCSIYFL